MELIVNNEPLDLSEELVMSFQVADIANIDSRQGDYSYEFDLPATQKNRRLLKRSHTIFGSPYQYIESWLRSGVDVKKGFIQVTEYDKGFKANFFSGNSNWIAAIGDKTLADLNLSVFDHVYSLDNVIGSFGNTEGYIYPYMNVKSGPDRDAFVGAWGQTIDDGYIAFTKQGGDFYGDYFNEGNFDEFYYTADDDMTVSVYAYINVTALTGAEALISIKINDNLTTASDSELITTTGVVILRKAIEVKENDRIGIYVDVNPDDADPGDATIGLDSYVRFTTSFVDLENIAFTELYPALYVHSLIKQIFQEVNFKLGGPFLNNPDYKRMIVPFVGSTFSQVDQSVISKSVYIGLLAEVTLNTEAIYFNDETDPYYDNGNWNTPRYNVVGELDEAYTVDIEVALNITGTGVTTSDIEIRKNGVAIFVETVPGTGLSTYNVSTNVVLGDYIEAWIVTGSDLTIGPGSYIKVTADESITSGTKIDIALVPPEMKQIDLVSFVFISYGVVPVVDDFSKTLTLTEFRAIKQKSPEDWSAKLAGQYEIDFYEFSHRYAKRNAFKYTDYDDEAELTNYKARNKSNYGDGEIRLDNIFLTGDATIYVNKFVPVNFKQVEINGQTANLAEFIRDNKPRILFVVPNATVSDFASFSEIMIEDEVYPVTQIAWAYFTKYKLETDLDDFRTNLSYQLPNIVNGNGNGLLSKYWEDYAGILNRPKMLIAPFKLSIKDLITLDWTRRKLVTGENITGYYFLNRIKDYNFNSRVAQCEMMLIDSLDIEDLIITETPELLNERYMYAVPFNYTAILKMDANDESVSEIGSFASGGSKYQGAVYVGGRYIYGIPFTAGNILKVDSADDSVTIFGAGELPPFGALYAGGAVINERFIYTCPQNNKDIAKIDISDDSISLITNTNGGYRGAVAINNRYVYFIPYSTTTVLKLDTADDSLTTFGSLSSYSFKWVGAAKVKDRYIYAAAWGAGMTDILKIDTLTDTISQIAATSGYEGAVQIDDRYIYFIPSTSTVIMKIDTSDDSVTTFGSLAGGPRQWRGAIVNQNRFIYCVPCDETSILKIDTSDDSISYVGSLAAGTLKWANI